MREEILHLGGTFEFESCVTDIRVENQKIKAVEINHNTWLRLMSLCGCSTRKPIAKAFGSIKSPV